MHSSLNSFPPVDCLVAALVAQQLGSFSAAAVELGVTHAAISRRVAGAESWAKAQLFERHARGVRVTPHGQRLLSRIKQSFQDIELLIDRPQKFRARALVRIATTPSFARFWLLPRLKRLEGTDLRIEIVASNLHNELLSGTIDLAIRYGRGGWRVGAEHALFAEKLVPVGLASRSESFDQQSMQQVLLHNGDTVLWRSFAKFNGLVFQPKATDRVLGDYALAIDAACAGLGFALWNPSLHTLPKPLRTWPAASFKPALQYFRALL